MPSLPRSLRPAAIPVAAAACVLAAGTGPAHAGAARTVSGECPNRSLLDVLCPVTDYVDGTTRGLTGRQDPPASPPRPSPTTEKPRRPASAPERPGRPESAVPPKKKPRAAERPAVSPHGASRVPAGLRAPGPRPDPRNGAIPEDMPVMPFIAPDGPVTRLRAASPEPLEGAFSPVPAAAAAGLAGLVGGLHLTLLGRQRGGGPSLRPRGRHRAG
ncbi:hypothetical protein [Actinomadura sp. 21ATH]|uniref:hypothetical protein n=1 Tax=Actinomadura sp. 21ATH TaxID=1735444 RepID=UPI0035C07158